MADEPEQRLVAKKEQNKCLGFRLQNTNLPGAWHHHNNLAWKPQITPSLPPSHLPDTWHTQRIPGSPASDWLLPPDPGLPLAGPWCHDGHSPGQGSMTRLEQNASLELLGRKRPVKNCYYLKQLTRKFAG